MDIRTVPYGPLGANLYIAGNNGRYILIDPCVRPEKCNADDILDKVDAVLMTHGHFDHIIFADIWNERLTEAGNPGVPFYIHPDDRSCLTDTGLNLSSLFGYDIRAQVDAHDITELDGKNTAGLNITIINTPGHSRGEVCILAEDPADGSQAMFTGDMLFAGSVGRTDFPSSNPRDMMNSVGIIKAMDDEIRVFPGHGPSSTLRLEKQYNPYFK